MGARSDMEEIDLTRSQSVHFTVRCGSSDYAIILRGVLRRRLAQFARLSWQKTVTINPMAILSVSQVFPPMVNKNKKMNREVNIKILPSNRAAGFASSEQLLKEWMYIYIYIIWYIYIYASHKDDWISEATTAAMRDIFSTNIKWSWLHCASISSNVSLYSLRWVSAWSLSKDIMSRQMSSAALRCYLRNVDRSQEKQMWDSHGEEMICFFACDLRQYRQRQWTINNDFGDIQGKMLGPQFWVTWISERSAGSHGRRAERPPSITFRLPWPSSLMRELIKRT